MALLSGGYEVTFDAASIAKFKAMITAAPIFAKFYGAAMAYSVNAVRAHAQDHAPVRQEGRGYGGGIGGGGTLRRGITGFVRSPFLGEVGVPGALVPYARRREYGFSGMTDSLGRYYANDPGAFYMKQGMEDSLPQIAEAFRTAAQLTVAEINAAGGGL